MVNPNFCSRPESCLGVVASVAPSNDNFLCAQCLAMPKNSGRRQYFKENRKKNQADNCVANLRNLRKKLKRTQIKVLILFIIYSITLFWEITSSLCH